MFSTKARAEAKACDNPICMFVSKILQNKQVNSQELYLRPASAKGRTSKSLCRLELLLLAFHIPPPSTTIKPPSSC